jgi:hypothetical protein
VKLTKRIAVKKKKLSIGLLACMPAPDQTLVDLYTLRKVGKDTKKKGTVQLPEMHKLLCSQEGKVNKISIVTALLISSPPLPFSSQLLSSL